MSHPGNSTYEISLQKEGSQQASNFVKFQERNSGKENCKELPSTKLHLSNLHSSDRKAKNFHPRNSTQVSLGDEERRQQFLAR